MVALKRIVNKRRGPFQISNLHPSHAHYRNDCQFCLPAHLKVPDHRRRDRHDDEIHEDGQSAACHNEVQAFDALAMRYDCPIWTDLLVHSWTKVGVADRRALKDVHNAR